MSGDQRHRQGRRAEGSRGRLTDCRFCGAVLAPLERMRGDGRCDRSVCRMKAGRERIVARREAELARRRAAQGTPPEVPVVWIEGHGTRLIPLPAALRQAYALHLQALAGGPLPPAEPAPPPAPADVRVCAFCRGRCCRYGAGRQAFITAVELRRWLDAHPGAHPAEAAADYLSHLPERHVENSCVNHGPQGCTLPGAMRSDTCNRYVCGPLVDAPESPELVAAMEGGASGVQRAVWITPDGPRTLRRR